METAFLAYVRGRCKHLPRGGVHLGIGDDAAVIEPPGRTVLATDQIVDGVDFRYTADIAADVGYKSVTINLSDIAAMGATPHSMLVTLTLPDDRPTEVAAAVYEGILRAAEQFRVAIVGGDLTTYPGPLAISVTLIGTLTGDQTPWTRGGGDVDQVVHVSGPVGGSILGRHLRPLPRLALAERLRQSVDVTAAIDVSDGLSLDLDRLLAASGVGVLLDQPAVPIHPDAVRLAQQTGQTPFRHAWSDGEDFELIFLTSRDDAAKLADHPWSPDLGPRPVPIGVTTSRTGLWTQQDGKHVRLSPQGYVHGRPADAARS